MGAFLGLLAGVGALLIWQGLTPRAHGPRRHPRADRVREELAQAGLSGVTPNQLIAVQVGVSVLVLVIGIVVTGSLSVSIVFGLFASVGPRLLVARLRRRRQSDLRDLWPEVVDNLISGVRAGLSLPEALSSLGTRGPEPLREPFRHFGSDYRTTGKFGDCLDRLKTALADPVGDRSANRCGWLGKWAGPIWVDCWPPCRHSCAKTPGPGLNCWPGNPGR